jgi:hypothetical protein
MLKKKLLTDRSGDLQEQILEEKAKALADEIDAEVLRGMLVGIGWHQVVVPWVMTHEQSTEVDVWVSKRVKGRFWNRGLVWLFEEDTDAMWFKMRWLG